MSRQARPWFYKQTGWWMAWVGGRKAKLAKGKANKKAARDRLEELLDQAAVNAPAEKPQTVASVIETYLALAPGLIAASTLEMRQPHLQSFAEAHGWRGVTEAKPLHVQEWLNEHPTWGDWTKNGAVRTILAVFGWAAKTKLIAANPFLGASHRAGLPRRDMTPAEFHAILRAMRSRNRKRPTPAHRFRKVLIFLYLTGCRPGEAAKLRWEHINFNLNLIVLPNHKTARTQRVPRPRVIALHPRVVRLLKQIQAKQEGDLVFLTYRKTPWNKHTLAVRVKRARRNAGVPEDAKLYGVRHAFGTRAVLKGVNLKTLSELLGHTTTRMSEYYVHLAGQYAHLADAIQQVNGPR
jgi:integrase